MIRRWLEAHVGTQTGFTPAIVSQLGGGLASAAFRITLFDGDSRSGNFDFNNNWLDINGSRIQNFSVVSTIETNGTGDDPRAALSRCRSPGAMRRGSFAHGMRAERTAAG